MLLYNLNLHAVPILAMPAFICFTLLGKGPRVAAYAQQSGSELVIVPEKNIFCLELLLKKIVYFLKAAV